MASKKQLETLLETFQGNSYPGMLEDLGHHLGVSADSCRRLALGWAPVVTFKKGKNFLGWWVIPERNADGVPVGLSLRSQSDLKVMYNGSKHGLVYEVNPEHERGGAGYAAGASNWVRTADAGLLCPICQKPDGCLLSAEDVEDPKAVVCIREKIGAEKPMKFGYLHIRKADGNLKKGMSALAGDPNEYVVVVEGFSDTAAALDLGFPGVGRPSNLACMDMLRDLVRGRRVVIVGENDKKPDGKEPGKEGMIAAFQVCRAACSDIRMVMPPSHVKDFRAWKSKFGLTREEFLAYVEEQGQEKSEELVLPDSRPLTIARSYLHEHHRMAGRYTIKRWAGSWYRYAGSKYEEVKDEAFESPIYPWAHDKFVNQVNPSNGAVTIQPLVANSTMVQNMMKAIVSETLLTSTQMPCWINDAKGIDPGDLIVFSNGLLHVPSFLSGAAEDEYLLELTPDFFSITSLPFAFDGTATCPTWKLFLRKSLGDEQEKIMLIREWIGYCMTNDTRMEKMMYLRGPSGAGKGVILHVLCKLVGDDHAVDTSFSQITTDFGTQALVGKLVCTIGDARTSARMDVMRGLEVLLNITSGDGIQINRKFKDPLSRYKIPARITIASNEFLDVPDTAGAMLRRLNIIEFKQSFVGREDFDLKNKLTAELPGIAVWALTGLRRLREQGRFTIPPSSMEAAKEWRMGTSPLASFIDECCENGGEVTRDELYDVWVQWSREKRISQVSMRKFMERVKHSCSHVVMETVIRNGHELSVYRGLTLKQKAARRFLGRP
jgi:putative DNA primase/helicase